MFDPIPTPVNRVMVKSLLRLLAILKLEIYQLYLIQVMLEVFKLPAPKEILILGKIGYKQIQSKEMGQI